MPTSSSSLVVNRSIKKFQIKQKRKTQKEKEKQKQKQKRNKAENEARNDEQCIMYESHIFDIEVTDKNFRQI